MVSRGKKDNVPEELSKGQLRFDGKRSEDRRRCSRTETVPTLLCRQLIRKNHEARLSSAVIIAGCASVGNPARRRACARADVKAARWLGAQSRVREQDEI